MKINKSKMECAMANACMNPYDVAKVAGVVYQSVRRALSGTELKPRTVGKIAKALNVDVAEIL